MDRRDAALLVVAFLGLALFLAAPAEPTYSMSVDASPDADPTESTDFVDLDADAQLEFLSLLDDDRWRSTNPPALENTFVRYKDSLYRVSVSVSESSVFSLLQPVVGGGILLVGALGLVVRRVIRRYRG